MRKRSDKNNLLTNYTNNEYYVFGKEYLGPFLYGFTNWLRNELLNSDIHKVYFIARDGYLMQRAFMIYNGNNEFNCNYIYFSRDALRFGLIGKCNSYRDSLKYMTCSRYVQFKEILSYYGFSEVEMSQISKDKHIPLSQSYLYANLEKESVIENIFNEFQLLIKARSQESFDNLCLYLKQINMCGKFAIVDIGWHGSIQKYLTDILRQCEIEANITGLYVGIYTNKKFNEKYGEAKGFLYDNKNPKLRKSVLCFLGGYEKLFQGVEGSTSGYIREGDKIVPQLRPYEYEDDPVAIDHIKSWQQGALDYIVNNNENGVFNKNYIKYARPLIHFGKYPNANQLKIFTFLYNTDGEKIYYLPQKCIFKYSPLEFVHALSNSSWKTGFMKAAFKIPFPYFIIYSLLKK